MADTVKRTLDDFAKLLWTIFDEDDDPKGISSDNKSNLDSLLEIQSEELRKTIVHESSHVFKSVHNMKTCSSNATKYPSDCRFYA